MTQPARLVSRTLRLVAGASSRLSGAALLVLMVLTFLDVFCRSAFNAPIEITTEVSRLLLMVVVFAALPGITLRDQHVSVDLLSGVLDRFGYARVEGVIMIGTAVLLIWPITRIHVLAERAMRYGDATEFLGFPVFLATWFVLIFTAFTAVCFLVTGLARLFGRAPQRDGGGALT